MDRVIGFEELEFRRRIFLLAEKILGPLARVVVREGRNRRTRETKLLAFIWLGKPGELVFFTVPDGTKAFDARVVERAMEKWLAQLFEPVNDEKCSPPDVLETLLDYIEVEAGAETVGLADKVDAASNFNTRLG